MNSGVYQIMNMRNHHMYIGSTVDFSERWAKHKWLLKKGLHSNIHLQRAWNKDGENLFEFSEVEHTDRDSKILAAREQYYTDLWKPEYAIRRECVVSRLGCRHSEETKHKMRKHRSEETKEKMRKPKSEEHKKNMRIAKQGNIPWNKGKHLSEEYKKKISKTLTGTKLSDETKEKISVAIKKVCFRRRLESEARIG